MPHRSLPNDLRALLRIVTLVSDPAPRTVWIGPGEEVDCAQYSLDPTLGSSVDQMVGNTLTETEFKAILFTGEMFAYRAKGSVLHLANNVTVTLVVNSSNTRWFWSYPDDFIARSIAEMEIQEDWS